MTVPIGVAADEFKDVADPVAKEPSIELQEQLEPSEPATRRSTRDSALSKVFVSPPAGETRPLRIPYEQDGTIRFLPPGDILAIKAQGHYSGLINGKESVLFCPWAISKLEKALDGSSFLRTHRSFLVNLQHVAGFRREGDKGYCLMREGAATKEIPVSRSQVPAIQKALGLD